MTAQMQSFKDRSAMNLQTALVALQDLRHAMEDGKPLSVQLAALEELASELLNLESRLGVVTPLALFS